MEMNLGPTIRDIQREAASLSAESLRVYIQLGLEVQDAAIGELRSVLLNAGDQSEVFCVTVDVVLAALATALFVRELTARPAPCFEYAAFNVN